MPATESPIGDEDDSNPTCNVGKVNRYNPRASEKRCYGDSIANIISHLRCSYFIAVYYPTLAGGVSINSVAVRRLSKQHWVATVH